MAAALIGNIANAQTAIPDSFEMHPKNLPDITVVGQHSKSDIQQMPEIVGTSIYAGKKKKKRKK